LLKEKGLGFTVPFIGNRDWGLTISMPGP